jgi:hypothetical protein
MMGGNVLAAIQIRPQGRAVVCVVVVVRVVVVGGRVVVVVRVVVVGGRVVVVGGRVVVVVLVVVVVFVCLFLPFVAALIFLSWQKSPGIQKDLVGQYNKNFSNFTVSR